MGETNGRGPGRAVAPLPRITLAGVSVRLHRVGPTTLREIAAQVRREWQTSDDPDKQQPRVPVVTTGEITEANEADPDYQAALRDWQERLERATWDRTLDYLALEVVEPLDGVDLAEVARLRASLRRFKLPCRWDDDPFYADLSPDERDRMVYVAGVLMDSARADEVRQFNAWVYRSELPSEQEVGDALSTFRPHVAGAAAPDGGAAAAAQPAGDSRP